MCPVRMYDRCHLAIVNFMALAFSTIYIRVSLPFPVNIIAWAFCLGALAVERAGGRERERERERAERKRGEGERGREAGREGALHEVNARHVGLVCPSRPPQSSRLNRRVRKTFGLVASRIINTSYQHYLHHAEGAASGTIYVGFSVR